MDMLFGQEKRTAPRVAPPSLIVIYSLTAIDSFYRGKISRMVLLCGKRGDWRGRQIGNRRHGRHLPDSLSGITVDAVRRTKSGYFATKTIFGLSLIIVIATVLRTR
jgi:hypothetical protein